MKSTFMRIFLISVLLTLFIPNYSTAEIRTFIKEYTYQASELDSKASSRIIALEQVKRLLLEELGSYLESTTEVKYFELSKDKITALTAGVVKTQIIDEKWDGKNFWLKASIKANVEKVAKSIDTLRKNQRKVGDLEEKIKQHDEALKEMDKLRNEMASLKNDIMARERYNKSVQVLNKEETFTDDWSVVSVVPSEFKEVLYKSNSSRAKSWTWKPGKNVTCIVQLIKAVNGTAFLKMATIMLSKKTYNSEYDISSVIFTKLELIGSDSAGNIHYKQHQSIINLANVPIHIRAPMIASFLNADERTVFSESEVALSLIQMEMFSKNIGETNNYICPIGMKFKLNNFLFHNISFRLDRVGNTNEFDPTDIFIETMVTMKEE